MATTPVHERIEGRAVVTLPTPTPSDPDKTTDTTYDILNFRVSYGVNQIPVAQASLAVGKKGASITINPAKISDIGNRYPVKLYLSRDGTEKLVFKGYVAGLGGYRDASQGKATVIMSCVHWLDDLNMGVAIDDNRGALASYSTEGHMPFLFDDTGANIRLSIPAVANAIATSVKTGNLFNAIYYSMRAVMDNSTFTGVTTTKAVDALKNFRGFLLLNQTKMLASDNMSGTAGDEITAALATTYNGGTMWGALRALASSFRFLIIPAVSDVFVIPSCRVVTSTKVLTDITDDYTILQCGRNLQAALSGVVLMGGANNPVNELDGVRIQKKAAYYSSTRQGPVELIQAPTWLCDIPGKEIDNTYSASIGLVGRGVPQKPANFAGAVSKLNTEKTDRENLGKAWCKAVFLDRVMAGDAATLIIPVEYDILPGTCIKLTTVDSEYSATDNTLSSERSAYGFVSAVTLVADAPAHTCYREITLTHLRSTKDDTDAMSSHPLFRCALPMGGELVDGAIAFSLQSDSDAQQAITALVNSEKAGGGAKYVPTTTMTYDTPTKALFFGAPSTTFTADMKAAAPSF